MKLEKLLSEDELKGFKALVTQASTAGAQAVRWYSPPSNLAIVGICTGGELLTWFASPAYEEAEANITHMVVLAGLQQAGLSMSQLNNETHSAAQALIEKVSRKH